MGAFDAWAAVAVIRMMVIWSCICVTAAMMQAPISGSESDKATSNKAAAASSVLIRCVFGVLVLLYWCFVRLLREFGPVRAASCLPDQYRPGHTPLYVHARLDHRYRGRPPPGDRWVGGAAGTRPVDRVTGHLAATHQSGKPLRRRMYVLCVCCAACRSCITHIS